MAFAPSSVCKAPYGDGSVLGFFREKEEKHLFEYSRNDDPATKDRYPHKVWVHGDPERSDYMFRYAKVLKTRAYIWTDVAGDGSDVVELWLFGAHKVYPD